MVCLFTNYSLPAFVVLISSEIVRQRRWRRLATEDAGVEVTGPLPMQVNGAFHGIEKTRVIKAYNISIYGIDFFSDWANKAMIKNKHKRSIKGPTRPGPQVEPGPVRLGQRI